VIYSEGCTLGAIRSIANDKSFKTSAAKRQNFGLLSKKTAAWEAKVIEEILEVASFKIWVRVAAMTDALSLPTPIPSKNEWTESWLWIPEHKAWTVSQNW